jgi:RAB protein geranylgeranyltransferase component A
MRKLIIQPITISTKMIYIEQKPLIIGSYYRPPNRTDNEYVNNSINELSELCTGSNNATAWIGGDFNLSAISWPSGNITSSNHTKKLNRSFLDTFKDCLLEQIVNFPTRKKQDSRSVYNQQTIIGQ